MYILAIHLISIIGCLFNGQEFQVGEQAQPDCSTRCTCRAGGNFTCTTVPCLYDGPTCIANGDPHYLTFDGRWHHFQGACEYVLTRPCANNDFSITARNVAHNGAVSCVAEVTISVPGQNLMIVLGRAIGGTVTINGALQPNTGDGIIYQSNGVEVVRTGGLPHVFLSSEGLRVFWDGNFRVDITVASHLQGQLCGLCGTYNGNRDDDYTDPSGAVLADVNAFGDSWLVPSNMPGCTGTAVGKREVARRNAQGIPECLTGPLVNAIAQVAQTRCAVLRQGVFATCNALVDPATFIENCEFDYCCCPEEDRDSCLCDNIEAYAAACADVGVALANWRDGICRK